MHELKNITQEDKVDDTQILMNHLKDGWDYKKHLKENGEDVVGGPTILGRMKGMTEEILGKMKQGYDFAARQTGLVQTNALTG